jgi:hypothetical protein
MLSVFYEGQERTNMILTLGQWNYIWGNSLLRWNLSVSVFILWSKSIWYFCSIPLGELDSNIGSETYGDVAFTREWFSTKSCSKWSGCVDCKCWEVRISRLEKKNRNGESNILVNRFAIELWNEVIDSAGFSIHQFLIHLKWPALFILSLPLVRIRNIRAINFNTINRFFRAMDSE